jgi:hypothetical protein
MSSFRIDLHVHTRESSFCGKTNGSIVAELYKKAGYDGLVITDHYNKSFFRRFPKTTSWEKKIDRFLLGYYGALEKGNQIGLKIFLGIELKFDDSPREFLIYGIDESFLKAYPELYKLGLEKFRKLTKELAPSYEILIYQAHPFRPGITPVEPDLIDGIEVYNGNPRQNSNNKLAFSFAKKNNLRKISGSDFHRLTDLARGGMILTQKIEDSRDLVQLLKKEREIQLITNFYTPLSFLKLLTSLANLAKKFRGIKSPRCGPLR